MPQLVVARVDCVVLDGADAHAFAHAQFSSEVQALAPRSWQWSAWLDAHGRVRALMQLANPGDGRLLAILRGGDAGRLCAELGRYRLRAHVDLGICTLTGIAGEPAPAGQLELEHGDVVIGCGDRSLRLRMGEEPPDAAAANRWRLADIRSGWPTLPPEAAGLLPPALGLERLGAVSFTKGCYPGQEIAARLHYRGGHKFRLCHVRGPVRPDANQAHPAGPDAPVRVLASAADGAAFEALVVAPSEISFTINILQYTFNVLSIYDA